MSNASVPERATSARGDRRGRTIVVAVVAVIVGLAVLRELIAPDTALVGAGVGLGGTGSAQANFARPAGLLVDLVGQLVALTWLAGALDRRRWRPTQQVMASLGLSVLAGTLHAVILKLWTHVESPISRALVAGPIGGTQIYALWLLAFRYPQIADDARVRALEADRLRQSAELSRLREHLQPHFVRNTLNTIAAFVSEDPDQARELLAALGDLLSESIESDAPTHPLADEMAWLLRYAAIFEARHRGALRFRWKLDPAANAVQIPRLLLQPLVENAVRHGALGRDGDGEGVGEVLVQTRRTERGVMLVVQDNGPGVDTKRPEGLGLRLVRRRLAIECMNATLHIDSSGSGTRVVVELP